MFVFLSMFRCDYKMILFLPCPCWQSRSGLVWCWCSLKLLIFNTRVLSVKWRPAPSSSWCQASPQISEAALSFPGFLYSLSITAYQCDHKCNNLKHLTFITSQFQWVSTWPQLSRVLCFTHSQAAVSSEALLRKDLLPGICAIYFIRASEGGHLLVG